MSRTDVISRWAGTVQFPIISSARRLVLSSFDKAPPGDTTGRRNPWDYIEVDNRGNKGAIVFWAVNGRTTSSTLTATFADDAETKQPKFRLRPDEIDRVFITATSVSVMATGNATTIYITVGKF